MTVEETNPWSSPPPVENRNVADSTQRALDRWTAVCMVIGNVVFIAGILAAGFADEIYGNRTLSTSLFASAALIGLVLIFTPAFLFNWFHITD